MTIHIQTQDIFSAITFNYWKGYVFMTLSGRPRSGQNNNQNNNLQLKSLLKSSSKVWYNKGITGSEQQTKEVFNDRDSYF
jgi:hypothetical protein